MQPERLAVAYSYAHFIQSEAGCQFCGQPVLILRPDRYSAGLQIRNAVPLLQILRRFQPPRGQNQSQLRPASPLPCADTLARPEQGIGHQAQTVKQPLKLCQAPLPEQILVRDYTQQINSPF
ncbi:hypothetical protein D3C75_880010 [compost metagenome]